MSDPIKGLNQAGLSRLLENIKANFARLTHTHTKSDITDFPTIPSKTSDLTNDSGYITANDVPTASVTGVKGDAESTYRSGNVNLTASNIKAVGIYNRNDIGTAPNWDNPGVNGLFEVRGYEQTGATGAQPFTDYGTILSVKTPDNVAMFQLAAATNSTILKFRAKQAANVTLSSVAWKNILHEGNYTTYVTPSNIGAAASTHSHAASAITSGTLDDARIPSLAASKINSGTLASARLPVATASAIGGVKPNNGLTVNSSGGLSLKDVRLARRQLISSTSVSAGSSVGGIYTTAGLRPFAIVMWSLSDDMYTPHIFPWIYADSGVDVFGINQTSSTTSNLCFADNVKGTHYSRYGMSHIKYNPQTGEIYIYNIGTGYKGTSANTSAAVPQYLDFLSFV